MIFLLWTAELIFNRLARAYQGYLVQNISQEKMIPLLKDLDRFGDKIPVMFRTTTLDFVCCHFKELSETTNLQDLPKGILASLLQRISEKYIL